MDVKQRGGNFCSFLLVGQLPQFLGCLEPPPLKDSGENCSTQGGIS